MTDYPETTLAGAREEVLTFLAERKRAGAYIIDSFWDAARVALQQLRKDGEVVFVGDDPEVNPDSIDNAAMLTRYADELEELGLLRRVGPDERYLDRYRV